MTWHSEWIAKPSCFSCQNSSRIQERILTELLKKSCSYSAIMFGWFTRNWKCWSRSTYVLVYFMEKKLDFFILWISLNGCTYLLACCYYYCLAWLWRLCLSDKCENFIYKSWLIAHSSVHNGERYFLKLYSYDILCNFSILHGIPYFRK